MSGNQALNTNAGVGERPDLAITDHGSDWYWAVCALMALSTFTLMGLSYTKRKTHRLFHYITAGITLVASISYFSMAAGLGQTAVQAEFQRPDFMEVSAAGTRQIFWVRYVDYAITTPLILTNLFLTSAIPRPTMLATLLADELMVVCSLAGALTATSYKWGYFVFGLMAYFFVVYSLLLDGRRYASALGGAANNTFLSCAGLTAFIWFLYPIAWGISVGGNVIHPDSEAIFYGILDIFSKIVVGFMLVLGHKKIDPADLGINIREHTTLPRHEKHGFQRNHRNQGGHHDARKGSRDHRHVVIGHNKEVMDHHEGTNKHHKGLFNHHNRSAENHRSDGMGHNFGHRKDVTDYGETSQHRNEDMGHSLGHNKNVTAYERANQHRNEDNAYNRHGADYDDGTGDRYGVSDYDHRYGVSDYGDRRTNHRRRTGKSGGGGFMGLFRKKNRHYERDDDYRGRDWSPSRGGYHATNRSPDRYDYHPDGRSRYRGDYHSRDHSPARDEYRARQRSPARGGHRGDDRGHLTGGSGYHPDARRSFPGDRDRDRGDGRPSFAGEGYHNDGRRSLPRMDNQGNDHRPFLDDSDHRDNRRSAPSAEQDSHRYLSDNEHRKMEEPRSIIPGVEGNRQNIRSAACGNEYAAEDRRPISGTETHRQAARPALGSEGYGDTHHPISGDDYHTDNHRPSGEYRTDNHQTPSDATLPRHVPGVQEPQGSKTNLNLGTEQHH